MKKLSYEDGLLVLRDLDGKLFWSSHWVDLKGSCVNGDNSGGYKEILLEGNLTIKSYFTEEERTMVL
jgi:hypothetical protein